MGFVVTIDGPAASGKSSVSRELAHRLGWKWVSTGAFYRGLALVASRLQIDLKEENKLAELVNSKDWWVEMGDDLTRVYFQGKDVSGNIMDEEVGTIASKVSQYPTVRQALLEPQRKCAVGQKGLIAEGRDCGTVVFPDAGVKIFLTAHSESRAARRAKEKGASVQEVKQAQIKRDQRDQTRQAAPLQIPDQSIVVDTSNMNFEEVVDHIEGIIRKVLKK